MAASIIDDSTTHFLHTATQHLLATSRIPRQQRKLPRSDLLGSLEDVDGPTLVHPRCEFPRAFGKRRQAAGGVARIVGIILGRAQVVQ